MEKNEIPQGFTLSLALMDALPVLFFGGSLGVSKALIERADQRWMISVNTFPHQLCRVIVLEQIYRAFRIMHHEPYHK